MGWIDGVHEVSFAGWVPSKIGWVAAGDRSPRSGVWQYWLRVKDGEREWSSGMENPQTKVSNSTVGMAVFQVFGEK